MRKKSLKEFSSETLSNIMADFGKEYRIFNSEAQFQFELAWKIREEFDCVVRLEELVRVKNGKAERFPKKDYADIILCSGDFRIAIELKYKTSKLEISERNILLKAHGAADLGAYDFMWDVNRLQVLTDPQDMSVCDMARCSKGYALMLTNDSHYWTAQSGYTINREFLIGGDKDGKGLLKEGSHQWYTKGKEGNPGLSRAIVNTTRAHRIVLRKGYPFVWNKYCDVEGGKGNTLFKFITIEVERP